MMLTLIAFAIAAPSAAAGAAAFHSLDTLRTEIAAFAGAVPLLDPRLQLAACLAPALAWVDSTHTAVAVTCVAPAWRIFVAVQGAQVAIAPAVAKPQLLVRRGDAVTVNASGRGFAVAVDGIAEADGVAGARIRVRNRSTGGIVQALVGADGSLRVQALKPANGGR